VSKVVFLKQNIEMTNKIKGIPDNSSRIIPRLVCTDGAAEIDFCVEAFDAVERNRRLGPDGMMVHALLTIGSEMIMIEGEWPTLPSRAPQPDGSSPVVIFLYVEDVDKTIERAVAKGAAVIVQPQKQFWGDRIAWIMDPAGHVWTIATRIEETTAEERSERWDAIVKKKDA
jgi:PhnB protein